MCPRIHFRSADDERPAAAVVLWSGTWSEWAGQSEPPAAPRVSRRRAKPVELPGDSPLDTALKAVTPTLTRIAAKLCRDPRLEVDDLVQEGLFGAAKAFERYDASKGASLATWLTTCARGAMQDYVRVQLGVKSKKRRPPGRVVSLDADIAEGLAAHDVVGSDDPEAATHDAQESLDRALSKLEPAEREIAQGCLDGKTLREIGEDLGISESRVCQIRKGLKEKLVSELPPPPVRTRPDPFM